MTDLEHKFSEYRDDFEAVLLAGLKPLELDADSRMAVDAICKQVLELMAETHADIIEYLTSR